MLFKDYKNIPDPYRDCVEEVYFKFRHCHFINKKTDSGKLFKVTWLLSGRAGIRI